MAIDARQLKPAMMILLCVSTSAFAETGDDSLPPPPDARTMNSEAVSPDPDGGFPAGWRAAWPYSQYS